ncbi:MAG: isoprenylcysteine carboxylmethyltransferase family protein [Coriobacteriia bacterium]|nr:isoprenylcysteine carboxylmethyltransferase family protein [Coriobacteriia bacterium]
MTQKAWWHGRRGEWFVVVQIVLFAIVAIGPTTAPGLPDWSPLAQVIGSWLGLSLMLAGAGIAVAGLFRLGPNLTALPYPKDGSVLVDLGAYAIVRHPIYSGLITAAFGLGLWRHGWLTLLWALVLFAFFDVKSRLEERWLSEKFGDAYSEYRTRVKKLIPWVY